MNLDPQFWNIFWTVTNNVLLWVAATVTFLGPFPFSYIAYRGIAAGPTKQRLRNDLLLLGLVENGKLDETVDSLYQTTYSASQFITYIVLILLTSMLVTLGFIYRNQLGWLDQEPVRLAFFSFLGAYVFSIQELIRRYNTFDLQPQVYSSILIRMLVSVIFVFVVGLAINATAPDLSKSNSGTFDWGIVIAFIVGIFPSQGMRWLTSQTNKVFGDSTEKKGISLRNIQGISEYHESRLQVLGIDDVQNLATVDIRKILLTTRFDTQTIVNWIDQAILLTKVGDQITRYRDVNINTFSELRMRLDKLRATGVSGDKSGIQPQDLNSEHHNGVTLGEGERKRLATVFGLNSDYELDGLCDVGNYLNFVHISKYYEKAASVAKELSIKAEKSILDKISDPDQRKATMEELENDLKDSPDDANLLINLGVLYDSKRRISDALKCLNRALQINNTSSDAYTNRGKIFLEEGQYEQAIQDLTFAIQYDKGNKFAFNYRGMALSSIKHMEEAVEDFTQAIELDVRFADAYLNRGFAFNALIKFDAALKDFENNYLLDQQENFKMWYGWGRSLIGLGPSHLREAIKKLNQSTRVNSTEAIAFHLLGYAQMKVQPPEYETAKMNLNKAIDLDPKLSAAYINRGLLSADQGQLDDAIIDYNAALKIDPNQSTALFNKGMALYKLSKFDEALLAFQDTINKVQSGSEESNQAAMMLAKILAISPETMPGGNQ